MNSTFALTALAAKALVGVIFWAARCLACFVVWKVVRAVNFIPGVKS